MSCCRTLMCASLSSIERGLRSSHPPTFSLLSSRRRRSISASRSCHLSFLCSLFRSPGLRVELLSRSYCCIQGAVSLEATDCADETVSENLALVSAEDSPKDTVEELLSNKDDVSRLMKMDRRPGVDEGADFDQPKRWFPYLDKFRVGNAFLNSGEVLKALGPYISDVRKERFRNVVESRSYSLCLVVEGLSDFGNVSAVFRSADALGFQSVHVACCDSSKRYRENRHVSMGAEKWLDIELWESIQECFKILKSRGYRIATTHVGRDAVSIYDMDWSCPTAIVVGNENRGISDEALELSDLHCSIPMNGMVDSFNVSVAAGILMHHAVRDRNSRLGSHGDLTLEERQILLAEFSLRHGKNAVSIANEFAKRKADMPMPNL